MGVVIVTGAQWGDEGKGKVVDFLAEKADVVARATGGNNAGHTVCVGDETYKFHLLPSGVVHKGKLNICGNGMVIYPPQIIKEIKELNSRGFNVDGSVLALSSTAHVITEEQVVEDQQKGGKVGTTGRGIGPCYTAKVERTGLRMAEFVERDNEDATFLKPYVKDTYPMMRDAITSGKNVLIEGAQGTMLDIDHGTYPFVTSSNPTAGGQCTGLGIGPTSVDKVIGIVKAYVTRVGRGPFPTEQGTDGETTNEKKDEELTSEDLDLAKKDVPYNVGKLLRKRGHEYGTTTGRARRCGWYDAVITSYAVAINGLTSIVITKLDCFSDFDTIKICTGYKIDGEVVTDFPLDMHALEGALPVYEEVPGWKTDISSARSYEELPAEAQFYLKRIEELAGIPISIVSVGPKRDQTIILKEEELG